MPSDSHIDLAKQHLEEASPSTDEPWVNEPVLKLAEVHAQIALAEELRLLRKVLTGPDGSSAHVKVEGRVTGGLP